MDWAKSGAQLKVNSIRRGSNPTASADSTVRVWENDVGIGQIRKLWFLRSHSDLVCSSAFSSDSKISTTTSLDKSIKIFNDTSVTPVETRKCEH